MTIKESHAVALFESVSRALQAEKLVKNKSIVCKLVPVPRHLSSDCGVCLRFNVSCKDEVAGILQGKIDFFEIVSLE